MRINRVLPAMVCLISIATLSMAAPDAAQVFASYLESLARIRSYDVRFVVDERRDESFDPSVFGKYAENLLYGDSHYRMIFKDGKLYSDKLFFEKRDVGNGAFEFEKKPRERYELIWDGKRTHARLNFPSEEWFTYPESDRRLEPLMGPDQILRRVAGFDRPVWEFTDFEKFFAERPVVETVVNDQPAYMIEAVFSSRRKPDGALIFERGDAWNFKLFLSREHFLPLRYETRHSPKARANIVTDVVYTRTATGQPFPISAKREPPTPGITTLYRVDPATLKVNHDVPDIVFTPGPNQVDY